MAIVSKWEEIVEEGLAEIIVPRMDFYRREDGIYEPAWAPVFYNPVMRLSRDMTSLFTRVVFDDKEYYFIDVLAGTGVRGIRLALETSGSGIVNDVDPLSYRYIVRNLLHNKVYDRVKPCLMEANALLNSYTFSGIPVDYVDLDPYGSPIPFIDSTVKPLSKHGYLGVTATDSGPLTCSHKAKALRRYGVRCVKVDFEKELGLRILIYNLVFRSAGQDVALKPLISYMHRYYYRVFFEAVRSGRESHDLLDRCSGYLWYCKHTLERDFINDLNNEEFPEKCLDGAKPLIIGPLWICGLSDPDFLRKLYSEAISRFSEIIIEDTVELLKLLIQESSINNPYIRYDLLFRFLKRNMLPIREFIKYLNEAGYNASRSHFDPRAVKTNASIKDILELLS